MMKRAGLRHVVPALAVYSGAEMTLIARTTITDIKKWRGDNLLPNPSIKKMNVVKNIA